MALEKISDGILAVENVTNLSLVTSDTDGVAVDTKWYRDTTVFVNVSINSGAVTVDIQASHDGTTWFTINTMTYTAVTATDVVSFTDHFPFMRTRTTTQSSSTVTTTITGKS